MITNKDVYKKIDEISMREKYLYDQVADLIKWLEMSEYEFTDEQKQISHDTLRKYLDRIDHEIHLMHDNNVHFAKDNRSGRDIRYLQRLLEAYNNTVTFLARW